MYSSRCDEFCIVIIRCEDIYGNVCIQEIKKQLLPPIIAIIVNELLIAQKQQ